MDGRGTREEGRGMDGRGTKDEGRRRMAAVGKEGEKMRGWEGGKVSRWRMDEGGWMIAFGKDDSLREWDGWMIRMRDDKEGMVKTWMIRMGEERMEAVGKEGEKMRGWEGGKIGPAAVGG